MLTYVKTVLALRGINLFFEDRRAVTAVEYALIAALIAAAIIGAVTLLGKDVSNTFTTLGTQMGTANTTASNGG
jgi:pilus assembly protein Flp/PilA